MPEEAKGMIEKDPVQQEDGDSILTYTVKEALCDKEQRPGGDGSYSERKRQVSSGRTRCLE